VEESVWGPPAGLGGREKLGYENKKKISRFE
jgi:hypothetical protein